MHSSSFQIEVYCDWLTPLHVAKLPLVVYEPLTFVIMEQAAGDHAYLHMTMTNVYPPCGRTKPRPPLG